MKLNTKHVFVFYIRSPLCLCRSFANKRTLINLKKERSVLQVVLVWKRERPCALQQRSRLHNLKISARACSAAALECCSAMQQLFGKQAIVNDIWRRLQQTSRRSSASGTGAACLHQSPSFAFATFSSRNLRAAAGPRRSCCRTCVCSSCISSPGSACASARLTLRPPRTRLRCLLLLRLPRLLRVMPHRSSALSPTGSCPSSSAARSPSSRAPPRGCRPE